MNDSPTALQDLAVGLCENGGAKVALARVSARPLILLPTEGLNLDVVRAWMGRLGVEAKPVSGRELPGCDAPLARTATLVVCYDRRSEEAARTYAAAVGAPLAFAERPKELQAIAEGVGGLSSVSLFLLHDALEEPILGAMWRANRTRQGRGAPALCYGVMCGLTAAHLTWLVAKTLVWMVRPPSWNAFGWLNFDGFQERSQLWRIDRSHGEVAEVAPSDLGDPWVAKETHVAALYTHSVSFDASLGEVALCGHNDPPLAISELATAPSCFFDGRCFRLERSGGRLTRLLKAVHASPLFWFLNGCGVVPLGRSAFGGASAYSLGLLSGSAVGIIGPYITQVSNALRNRLFGALLTTGANLGETALALSSLLPEDAGFDSYVLLGSPDLRLFPQTSVAGTEVSTGRRRYPVRGRKLSALRLELHSAPGAGAVVVADDGAEAWGQASCAVVALPTGPQMLVTFDPPQDLDGWLELANGRGLDAQLEADAHELEHRLRVLKLYAFTKPDRERIEGCADLVARVRALAAVPNLVRRRLYCASLLAQIEIELHELGRSLASHFLDEVSARDINLDRESYNGFSPGTVRRTSRRCPACGSALFSALDRWLADSSYRRRKDLCANCFAVSMALERSSLSTTPPRLLRIEPGPTLALVLALRNRSRVALRAWVAAAPRLGAQGTGIGPHEVALGPGAKCRITFRFPLERLPPGTLSFRFLVVSRGAAEFHSFKYPAHPDRLEAGAPPRRRSRQ